MNSAEDKAAFLYIITRIPRKRQRPRVGSMNNCTHADSSLLPCRLGAISHRAIAVIILRPPMCWPFFLMFFLASLKQALARSMYFIAAQWHASVLRQACAKGTFGVLAASLRGRRVSVAGRLRREWPWRRCIGRGGTPWRRWIWWRQGVVPGRVRDRAEGGIWIYAKRSPTLAELTRRTWGPE